MKKVNRHRFLAIFTFAALVVLLAVQVSWLFQAAKFEEQRFNRKVNDALKEARDEIGRRVPSCNYMKSYLCGETFQPDDKHSTVQEIDSIIKSKLEIHHIELEYTFGITDSVNTTENKEKLFGTKCYLQSLNGLLEKNGIQIQLRFPNKNQFLLSQIRGAFLLAFVSVLFLAFSFIITFQMFMREQKMVQQTTDFINNMVHEFQTPLSNIRLATNLIRKREAADSDPKINEYTGVILKENQKMHGHVEEILKVSVTQKGTQNFEEADVHEIIRSVVDDFHHKLVAVDGVIKLDLKASNHRVFADPMQISLVFSNLIDNALKYTIHVPVIVISSYIKEKYMVLKVADNGIGMEKSELDKIFEKYYRISTGDIHNVKGFGLGLTYVKKIVESYKGKIKVASTPGKGTTFSIKFPIKDV
jgi:two-component system, OmpR family, phosphate regulon sensor histidine kinase PhoR